MIFFLKERPYKTNNKNAGSKARLDVNSIFERLGAKEIDMLFDIEHRKLSAHLKYYQQYKKRLFAELSQGDILFVQCPVIAHSVLLSRLFKLLQKKGIKIILIIHDLEILRCNMLKERTFRQKVRCHFEEIPLLKICDAVIAHNSRMKEFLVEKGIMRNKIIELGIFDYWIPDDDSISDDGELKEFDVMVAGNLMREKAGYIYQLPETPHFTLYGVGCEENELAKNITYKGSFLPDELVRVMNGNFGLVWDGPSADTCAGVFGGYMKYNNPHKTSLYLACGFPVIIWNEAAMADFIIKHDIGFAVKSLNEIPKMLDQLSKERYNEMCYNAKCMSEKLRRGEFMTNAIKMAIRCVENSV